MPKRLLHQNPPANDGQASLTPSHLNIEGHSELSITSMDSMGSMTDPGPFPFFKLPPEIRNMIYRLVVVTEECLVVRDMDRKEFKESQENGAYQSSYLALDHERFLRKFTLPLVPDFDSDHRLEPGSLPISTSYISHNIYTRSSMLRAATSMLALDKRSRDEVAYIFYGGNSFHFATASSLVPFMKDRTVETRKYIRNLYLTLIVDVGSWDIVYAEYGKPAIWNTAFSSLLKMSHVNIRKMCIHLIDNVGLDFRGDLRSRSMLWLHKLSRFDNLEMLGLQYTPGLTKAARPGISYDQVLRYEQVLRKLFFGKVDDEPAEELWRFLAPKMLKREADDHSPDALRHRRIHNFSRRDRSLSNSRIWPR